MLLTVTATTFADEASSFCKYGTYKQMLSGECLCTKNFPKNKVPKNVPFSNARQLVQVCGFVPNRDSGLDSGISGTFQFRVNQVAHGVVEYTVGPEGTVYFYAKDAKVQGWLESESDEIKELHKLKLGNLNHLIDGASAKSQLRVKEYYIQYDSGSVNRMGITKYDVIKIGKFQSSSEVGN